MPTTTRAPRPQIPAGGTAGWRFPHSELRTLPNGMRIHCFNLPGRTLTAARLLVRTPLPLEPTDGIGAVTAALWSMGDLESSAEQFAADLARIGASYHAEVTALGLRVAIAVNGAALPDALNLLAASMLQPAFRAADVDRQLKLHAAEYELAQSTAGSRAAEEIGRRTAPADSRFSRPVGGTPDTVAGLTSSAIAAYHHEHAVASRAELVLAGAIDPADLGKLATLAFSPWRAGEPATAATIAHRAPSPELTVVDRPGAAQTALHWATAISSLTQQEWVALHLAAHMLGGGMGSRLNVSLREENGYTYGVRTAARRRTPDGGVFEITTAVATDVTAAAVAETQRILAEAVEGGFRPAERDAAVDFLLNSEPVQLQSSAGVADAAAGLLTRGQPIANFDRNRDLLAKTSAEEATAVLRKVMPGGWLALAAVGDSAQITEPLRAVADGPVNLVEG